MKKEFSFYEFVGILVPSTILLFSLNLIISVTHNINIVDFGKIGETGIFIIVCYGFGHILQAIGNIFESIVWFIYGGMPTNWLNKKNRFNSFLFEVDFNQRILNKIKLKFGDDINDYGRITYNFLFIKEKTRRIDLFNGNYSLFRGLAVSFLIITTIFLFYFPFIYSLYPFIIFLLSTLRMIRFANYYAKEVFRTFFNYE